MPGRSTLAASSSGLRSIAMTPQLKCPVCKAQFASAELRRRHTKKYKGTCIDQLGVLQHAPSQPAAPPPTLPAVAQPSYDDVAPDEGEEHADEPQADVCEESYAAPSASGSEEAVQHGGAAMDSSTEQQAEQQTSQSPEERFDSVLALMRWMFNANRGLGLNKTDVDLLLKLLKDERFDIKEVPFDSAEQMHGWIDANDPNVRAPRILCKELVIEGLTLRFWVRDLAQWVQDKYGDVKFRGSFAVHANERYTKDGQRIYENPQECDAWLQAEAAVAHLRGVIAALQLYSDKHKLNPRLHAYPIRGALLNVLFAERLLAMDILGYLPIFARPKSMNAKEYRLLRMRVLAACLMTMLEPLLPLVQTGRLMRDPDGAARLVFVRLLSYVADSPEKADVAAVMHKRCARCLVSPAEFAQLPSTASARTEAQQAEFLQQLRGARTDKRRKLLQKTSGTLPLQSGAHGMGHDIHAALAYDSLHDEDLGTTKYVVECLGPFAEQVGVQQGKKGWGSKVMEVLQERLEKLPRLPDLPLPVGMELGYFTGGATTNEGAKFLQAKHHAAVAAVLPHLLHGLVKDKRGADKLTRLAALSRAITMKRHRIRTKKYFTEESLAVVERLVQQRQPLLQEVMGAAGRTAATLKVHAQSHFAADVRALGVPRHYSSERYEGQHQASNQAYKAASKKRGPLGDAHLAEMSSYHNIGEAFDRIECADPSSRAPVKAYQTAWTRASQLGAHVLQSKAEAVSLKVLGGEPVPMGLSGKIRQRSQTMLEHRPELLHLLATLRAHFSDAAPRRGRRKHYTAMPPLPADDIIKVVSGGVLSGWVEWSNRHSVLQTVRATSNFHSGPQFDFVRVRSTGGRADGFAQLRLLFRLSMLDGTTKEFAFVAWHQVDRVDDELTRWGCIRLKPEKYQDRTQLLQRYGVVELHTLKRRESCLPDFAKPKSKGCYVSAFIDL